MPTHRQRATAAAAETRAMFSGLHCRTGADPTSYLYEYSTPLPRLPASSHRTLASAIMKGDPFDLAVSWQSYLYPPEPFGTAVERAPQVHLKSIAEAPATGRVLVLNTCSENKPGGDWESGFLGPGAEESLARRSNLVQTLCTTNPAHIKSYYPLPQTGGIYSPNTVVLRAGYEKDYEPWPEPEWTVVSVVSVAAVKRPKMDEGGMRYSFVEEKELQKEKMRTILRIAGHNGHINLLLSGFGSCGPGAGMDSNGGSPSRNLAHSATSRAYKNPIRDVVELWYELLFETEEFRGYFQKVVFAVGGESNQKEFGVYFG